MSRIALVTGSNRGIGLAVVRELLEKGYTTILTSRDEKNGEKAISKLREFENLDLQILDITDKESIQNLTKYINEKYGVLDVLINNAAINYDTWQSAINADLFQVRNTIETNIMGAWEMVQSMQDLLRKSKSANIVNVSSGAGAFSEMGAGTPAYSLTKAALNVLTLKFAADLRKDNIIVNSVCPGWVRTDMGGMAAPRSPKKGAETIVWASELMDRSMTGKFFRDMKEIEW
ncbi:MAG: SDR family oxidoreductase [Marinifilaceae bacterium]|jgi:NAD(P)-dependent dehydrogenase (short-subunit alcohol dehydrogenase family)|nr:SDR family oxidoreductase [Marinifilaceae bacterium]